MINFFSTKPDSDRGLDQQIAYNEREVMLIADLFGLVILIF